MRLCLRSDCVFVMICHFVNLFFSGKLVSPKWKNFRGIKVKLKDKIRLNNIIWREWHRQCMHSTPLFSESVLLEFILCLSFSTVFCICTHICVFVFVFILYISLSILDDITHHVWKKELTVFPE